MRAELAMAARLRFAIGSLPLIRPCGATFPRGGGKALGFCSLVLAEAVTHAGAAVVNGGGIAGNGHSGHSPAENTLFLPIDHSCLEVL